MCSENQRLGFLSVRLSLLLVTLSSLFCRGLEDIPYRLQVLSELVLGTAKQNQVVVGSFTADMSTSVEWKKMKVQALRDELLSRGLDTAGLRSTLIERLEDFVSKGTGTDHSVAAEKKKEVEVQDDQANNPSERSEPAIKTVVENDMQASAEVANPLASKSLEEAKEPTQVLEVNGADSGTAPLTDLEKKQKRAERFGTELKITEDEKRRMRSARFNGASATNGAKKETGTGSETLSNVSPSTVGAEAAKRKARAERFGIGSISTTEPALKLQVSTDEEAKKKARLARFAAAK